LTKDGKEWEEEKCRRRLSQSGLPQRQPEVAGVAAHRALPTLLPQQQQRRPRLRQCKHGYTVGSPQVCACVSSVRFCMCCMGASMMLARQHYAYDTQTIRSVQRNLVHVIVVASLNQKPLGCKSFASACIIHPYLLFAAASSALNNCDKPTGPPPRQQVAIDTRCCLDPLKHTTTTTKHQTNTTRARASTATPPPPPRHNTQHDTYEKPTPQGRETEGPNPWDALPHRLDQTGGQTTPAVSQQPI